MMPTTTEEIAKLAGLTIGTFFVSAGTLYRVERYTKLRIYLKRYPLAPLAMDLPNVGVSGNQESYIEVPSYAISNRDGAGQQRADNWVRHVAERTTILTETDEAEALRRMQKAARVAAPLSRDIHTLVEQHRTALTQLKTERLSAITTALTGEET